MAEKRMYSKKITDSDAFIEMASSAQALYFHLNQGADDDGFNNQIQNAIFKAHASIDDLKVLLAKNFIIRFESGVVVIKHWWIHNTLRKDRYTPTNFQEELKLLGIKDNKSYTLSPEENGRLPNGCQMVAKRLPQSSVDKIREEENNKEKSVEKKDDDTTTTTLEDFLTEFNIAKDNYSERINEMDYTALSKAYRASKWLQTNITSLSRICKEYKRIIGGYYKDYANPNKMENSHGYSKQQLDSLVDNIDDIDF